LQHQDTAIHCIKHIAAYSVSSIKQSSSRMAVERKSELECDAMRYAVSLCYGWGGWMDGSLVEVVVVL
jgi:hypothetical protein